jgi:uncharacterized membrane protein YccF (DUF307 family)
MGLIIIGGSIMNICLALKAFSALITVVTVPVTTGCHLEKRQPLQEICRLLIIYGIDIIHSTQQDE